jgi:hypothetical protein
MCFPCVRRALSVVCISVHMGIPNHNPSSATMAEVRMHVWMGSHVLGQYQRPQNEGMTYRILPAMALGQIPLPVVRFCAGVNACP